MSKLNYLSATELIKQYRTGQTSPSLVMDAYIERFNQVNDLVNAFSFTFFDEAKTQAKQQESLFVQNTAQLLSGIAVAIKDETYIEGQVTTNGCLHLIDYVASSTDPVAQRLLNAGAIVHGRTTTPEFSVAATCWSDLWGISRNPWNLAITCGGSSGGSAIAVATGMCAFANGTDIGGSIRIPAAFCGLYGFKPAHGRVPEIVPYNVDPYCHHGVLARCLDDIKLGYDTIKGPDWNDSHSFIPATNDEAKPLTQIKVAISPDLGFYQVESDILAQLEGTVAALKNAGLQVDFVELNWNEKVMETAKIHQRANMGQLLSKTWDNPGKFEQLTSYSQWYLKQVRQLQACDILEANLYQCEMWQQLSPILQEYDVLICPTLATTNIPAAFDYSLDKVFINNKEVDPNKGWFMTYPFNTLGQCPVLTMPNGMCDNGVPSSIQIVGRPYQDHAIFSVAELLSRTVAQGFYTELFPTFGEK